MPLLFEDFFPVNLTVGKITEAGFHPNADGLLLLKVSLGYKDINYTFIQISAVI